MINGKLENNVLRHSAHEISFAAVTGTNILFNFLLCLRLLNITLYSDKHSSAYIYLIVWNYVVAIAYRYERCIEKFLEFIYRHDLFTKSQYLLQILFFVYRLSSDILPTLLNNYKITVNNVN